MANWKVTIRTPDGDEMIVHPEREATHGVYLAEDGVKGDIIDAPVKTEWDQLALQDGGTARGVSHEFRDFHLQFHVTDDVTDAETADSLLRMKFAYEEDEWDPNPIRQTQLDFESELSGVRTADVLMAETVESEFSRDPAMDQYFNPAYHLRAGIPWWYTPPVIETFNFPAGNTDGVIYVENPTDRPMRHSWIIAGGPGTRAFLPDFSWIGAKGERVPAGPYASRMIEVPVITPAGGGIRVTLRTGTLQVKDANGTNAQGRMPIPGQYFMHKIPSYTRRTPLPVQVRDVPSGGGQIQLIQPRYWSRPLGLEMW